MPEVTATNISILQLKIVFEKAISHTSTSFSFTCVCFDKPPLSTPQELYYSCLDSVVSVLYNAKNCQKAALESLVDLISAYLPAGQLPFPILEIGLVSDGHGHPRKVVLMRARMILSTSA